MNEPEPWPCPDLSCAGMAVFGNYLLTSEGSSTAFVDDVSEKAAITKSEQTPAWHCGTCGVYFLERSR
jgi:hypothetical protein